MGSYSPDEVVADVAEEMGGIFEEVLGCAVEITEGIDPELMRRALKLHDKFLFQCVNTILIMYYKEAQDRLNQPDVPAASKDGHTTELQVVKPNQAIDSVTQSWITDWEKDHPNYTQAERNQAIETIIWLSVSQFDSKFEEG